MISGTPINSQLTYFEMEVIAFSPETSEAGIGLTHTLADSLDVVGKSRHEIYYISSRDTKTGRYRANHLCPFYEQNHTRKIQVFKHFLVILIGFIRTRLRSLMTPSRSMRGTSWDVACGRVSVTMEAL
jgi:hypothetical protein